MTWPASAQELVAAQLDLARADPKPWRPAGDPIVGACFVCFSRGKRGPGAAGDPGWTGAALQREIAVFEGRAGAPYEPGLLALREGPLLEGAVRALPARPSR